MSIKKRVLVTDGVHTHLIDGLSAIFQVDYRPDIGYQEVCEIIPDYHGLVINSKVKVDKAFLDRAPLLSWVGRLGSGLDVIDLVAAKASGVTVMNSPEGNANAVGEHALCMLLSLLNKISLGDDMVRTMSPWDRESMRGRELDGMTVGIVGCGHTGSAFVKKLRGFDVSVLIYDKYRSDIPDLHPNQKATSLEDVVEHSDVISLHLPLTAETQNWIDGDFMKNLKSGCIILNTSRGAVVKLDDLVLALKSGKIGGACLDVFECEKPDQYTPRQLETMEYLTQNSHVMMSPHVAGWTIESKLKIAQVLLNKIIYIAESP